MGGPVISRARAPVHRKILSWLQKPKIALCHSGRRPLPEYFAPYFQTERSVFNLGS